MNFAKVPSRRIAFRLRRIILTFHGLSPIMCTLFLCWPCVASPAKTLRVAVGGTSGLASLGNPRATRRFRALAGTGFYVHYSATDPTKFGLILRQIAELFRGRDSIAELSLGGGFNPLFWTTAWRSNVLATGFAPDRVVVNVDFAAIGAAEALPPETLDAFQAFVAAGRKSTAVRIYAPVISPNQSGGPGAKGDAGTIAVAHPWSTEWWDGARVLALSGGGVALDAPPAFFLHGLPTQKQLAAYQRFEEDVLRWAHRNGLWSAAIVSPYFDGVTFADDTDKFRAALERAGTLPETWVVENYNECGDAFPRACSSGDAAFLVPVGSESAPNTVAAVALRLALQKEKQSMN